MPQVEDDRFGARVAAAGVALLAAGALAYLVAMLTEQGLYLDDLHSFYTTDPRLGFAQMIRDWVLRDPSPPEYFILLRWWREMVPEGEAWLRIPGVGLWALTVAAAAFWPCRTLTREARILFAGLVACSFGMIYLAQELRTYSLFALLAVTFALEALEALAIAESGNPLGLGRQARLVVQGWLLGFSHYFALLFAGAGIGAILAVLLARGRWSWRVFAVGVLILVPELPWMAIHIPLLQSDFEHWGRDSVVIALRGFLRFTFTGPVAAAALLVAAGLGLWLQRRTLPRLPLAFAGAAFAISLGVPVLWSLRLSIVAPHYLIGTTVLVYLALAVAMAPLLRRTLTALPALAALAAMLVSYHFVQTPRPGWRAPSAFIRAATTCDRREILFLAAKSVQEPFFRYYLPEPRFRFVGSRFDQNLEAELAGLEPVAPGCDVVAVAMNLDPVIGEVDSILAHTPFRAPEYEVTTWPHAFVVRRPAH